MVFVAFDAHKETVLGQFGQKRIIGIIAIFAVMYPDLAIQPVGQHIIADDGRGFYGIQFHLYLGIVLAHSESSG